VALKQKRDRGSTDAYDYLNGRFDVKMMKTMGRVDRGSELSCER
jgi:hypothetical protein